MFFGPAGAFLKPGGRCNRYIPYGRPSPRGSFRRPGRVRSREGRRRGEDAPMTLGAITWTCLLLTAAAPPDVWPLNSKEFQIPIHIDGQRRAEIKELDLYVSHDQGQTWNLEARVTPDKEYFPYVARETTAPTGSPSSRSTCAASRRRPTSTPPRSASRIPRGHGAARRQDAAHGRRQGDTTARSTGPSPRNTPTRKRSSWNTATSANGPWTNVAVTAGPTGHAKIPSRRPPP